MDAIPRVAHAFGTRVGEGRDDAAFLIAAGLGSGPLAVLRQVHGARVVDAAAGGPQPPEADGIYRNLRDGGEAPVPAVRTADCVPLLLVHKDGAAVAAVHAGWRGAAAGIGARALDRFASDGLDAKDVLALLGPAILGCCYEVGTEVVLALAAACGPKSGFTRATSEGRVTVDLHAALAAQLAASGVPAGSIHRAPFCTRCRGDLFFSYRRDGRAAGRLVSAVGPAAGP